MTELYQAAKKIKNLKKVKSILRIDDDLAQNMKDEINGVKRSDEDYEEEYTAGTLEEESMSDKVMVDSSLVDEVESVLVYNGCAVRSLQIICNRISSA